MQTLQVQTRVLPGNRIEVASPELPEGASVVVTILLDEQPGSPPMSSIRRKAGQSFLEFLDSLPPSTRTLADWDEYDREFLKERDDWDRK